MNLYPAALRYLSRYAASSGHLRQVLFRKVQRQAHRTGEDLPPEAEVWAAIDEAVAKVSDLGLLDDPAYAASLARQYRARGEPLPKIRNRLRAKGLEPEDIASALAPLDEDEAAAAEVYAKRKRLGPYRLSPGKPDQAKRDMAALCRAGFSLRIARAIVDGA